MLIIRPIIIIIIIIIIIFFFFFLFFYQGKPMVAQKLQKKSTKLVWK